MEAVMRTLRINVILAVLLVSASAQNLTTEQKVADFRSLAGIYAKQYASYEWKRELFGFDALRIETWLDRVTRTTNDLDFYEVCVDYIASFNDTHIPFIVPSSFVASLGLTVDIFDGKVLIDSVTRSRLPLSQFPFDIGDELVSVDGKQAEELIRDFMKYAPQSNSRSTRRMAAARIVTRPQSRMPHAADLGESASVEIRLQSGDLRTFTIPWIKTGIPMEVGPVPSPKRATVRQTLSEGQETDLLLPWLELQHSASNEPHGVLGYGSRTPIFALPANFVQRQGRAPADFFYSGTYTADGMRIGYIRVPSYGSLAQPVMDEFLTEISFFEENTDGLVVDEMRNPGGFLCLGEFIVTALTPYNFRPTGYELRATWSRINGFYNALNNARAQNVGWLIDLYEFLLGQLMQAYQENRGRTGPIPLCTPAMERLPATRADGTMIAYTKPLLMLVDEFSTSTADSVPAMIQDARRGTIFGWRTNGAGGTNITPAAGAYSESLAGVVLGLMTRKQPIATPDYPTSHYIENVGVRPDIEVDYMTKDNLLQRGRPFVDAFTQAIVRQIRSGR